MRPSLLISSLVILFAWLGNLPIAKASHLLGAELVYEYIGTTASPNRYRISAYVVNDINSLVSDYSFFLTCGKNECGNTQPGSFTAFLLRTRTLPAPIPQCVGQAGLIAYQTRVIEGEVDLPPARWTLSINAENRRPGISNLPQSVDQSVYVAATLDNSTGLTNSSPKFTSHYLIQLIGNQPQRHSWSTFDSEGDSLTYELVRPQSKANPAQACGALAVGSTIAPHFDVNAGTGELLTRPIPVQQGIFSVAVAVNEYRRVNGTWQQIGQINRDMIYQAGSGSNQVPVFSRVAFSNNPTGQLLGQTIRASQGQTVVLNVTATDPDAGQTVLLFSEATGAVPGVTFQAQGNGQGQLSWQVPAGLPTGRYVLTVMAVDDACPGKGVTTQVISFLVSPLQPLASRERQPLAQGPYPMPFREEVRFQLTEKGSQPVVILDELGRTVAQLLSAADGSISWRPANTLPAGLYFARNLGGTQVARLAYAGQ
ncbi:hypothetical protein [Hymenobacter sp. B1770]|uniref:hypothetical protein n=1 Tax=Hymenobacter sp. B1770 TaxID=1718788 RepID=UPI003CE8E8E1